MTPAECDLLILHDCVEKAKREISCVEVRPKPPHLIGTVAWNHSSLFMTAFCINYENVERD